MNSSVDYNLKSGEVKVAVKTDLLEVYGWESWHLDQWTACLQPGNWAGAEEDSVPAPGLAGFPDWPGTTKGWQWGALCGLFLARFCCGRNIPNTVEMASPCLVPGQRPEDRKEWEKTLRLSCNSDGATTLQANPSESCWQLHFSPSTQATVVFGNGKESVELDWNP